MSLDPDREWKLWRSWMGGEPSGRTIYAQVVEMLLFRQIWDGFVLILEEAPARARRNGTFAFWVRYNYTRSQGAAVRRQTDVRGEVISIARLIDRVWRYPTVLSRARFHALQGNDPLKMADRWFTELAGDGEYMDPRIPAADMEDLRSRTDPVRRWVNRSVAHYSERGPSGRALDADTLNLAIDTIVSKFGKYMNLILGVQIDRRVLMSPWETVFRVPWISDDDQWRELARRIHQ